MNGPPDATGEQAQAINALLKRIKPHLDAIPKIRRLVAERDRAASERHTGALAELAYTVLKKKVDDFYGRVNRLNREALKAFRKELSGILTESEVHTLSRRIDLQRPSAAETYAAIQHASTLVAIANSERERQLRSQPEPASTGGTSAKPQPRKRGRPCSIPAGRKEEALQAKAQKSSNSAVAKILYHTQYPTPQQVKNVSSILNHYQRTRRSENAE